MPEKCKLKYLKICKNQDLVYEVIDEWNIFLYQNISASKEEKMEMLEQIKTKDFLLYQSMKEDINDELY